MSSIGDVTVKVSADTREAVRQIRALREEAQQPPLEVLLVAENQSPGRALFVSYLTVMVCALIGGLTLMLLLPLAHRTLNAPVPAVGYWDCVMLVALVRMTFTSTFGGIRPLASRRRVTR